MAHWAMRMSLAGALFVSFGLAQAQTIPYLESSRCGKCHRSIYAQWRASQMANSARDRIYQDLYRVAVADDASWALACARCHEPRAVVGGRLQRTPITRSEGVSCDYCHRIGSVVERNGVITHGPVDGGTEKRAVKHGPLTDAVSPFHTTRYTPVYSEAMYCAMCHQYTLPSGIVSESQYLQWKATALGAAGVVCQTCHMPARPGKVAYVPPTAPYRQRVHSHRFGGGDSPTRLLGSFLISFKRRRRRSVKVTIRNAVAGHNVPGHGHGMRRLELRVRAKDAAGRVLREKRWRYRRTFRAADGTTTPYFWRAVRVGFDNTIPSGASRTETFRFPRRTRRIVAKVIYRRYPKELLEHFRWRGLLTLPRTIVADSLEVR